MKSLKVAKTYIAAVITLLALSAPRAHAQESELSCELHIKNGSSIPLKKIRTGALPSSGASFSLTGKADDVLATVDVYPDSSVALFIFRETVQVWNRTPLMNGVAELVSAEQGLPEARIFCELVAQ